MARIVTVILLLAALGPAQNFSEIRPSPQQVVWQDLEFGVLIHFGTNTYLDREWGDGAASPQVFNPTQFDPEQWMRAIKAAGARYVVLVAKHHDGFCLWPTEQTDYSVKSSPWQNGKGDVVGAVAAAARKYGLKFGVYLSPWDRHEPKYRDSAAYDNYYLAELDELITRYGDLVEFWLDGAGSAGHVYNFARYIEELRVYQPNTLVFADGPYSSTATFAGRATKTALSPTRTGTSWIVMATCAGARPKPTRHCTSSTGSGIRTMRAC